jgi:hypothetical protein
VSDTYLFITPLLTLLVVSLVGFVGCDLLFGLDEVKPPPPAPPAPTGLRAEPGDGKVDLWWTTYTAVTAQKLTLSMGEAPGEIMVSRPYTDVGRIGDTWSGLTNGKRYYFTLTATANGQESEPSEEVSAVPGLYGVVAPLLEQTQLGTMRSFDGWMGVRITTGGSDQTLRALGRWFDANAMGTHQMRIAAATAPMTVLASVTVTKNAPAQQGEFVYTNLATTIPLAANTEYFVVSGETSTGDPFHDSDLTRVTIIDSLAGLEARAAFGDDAGNYTVAPTSGAAYGPVNILYTRP